MPEFRFVRWVGPDRAFALFEDEAGTRFIVPRSRLVPHPLCEYELEARGIRDPNTIAELCAERSSVFGPEIFRWYMHKVWTKRNPEIIDEEDIEKAYNYPPNTDFSCIRDCILKGGRDLDLCIAECSGW